MKNSEILGIVFGVFAFVYLGCSDSGTDNGNNGDRPLERDQDLAGLWVTPVCSSQPALDTLDISIGGTLRSTTFSCGGCANGSTLKFDDEWKWDQVDSNTIHLEKIRGKDCGEEVDGQVQEADVNYSVDGDSLIWDRNEIVYTRAN